MIGNGGSGAEGGDCRTGVLAIASMPDAMDILSNSTIGVGGRGPDASARPEGPPAMSLVLARSLMSTMSFMSASSSTLMGSGVANGSSPNRRRMNVWRDAIRPSASASFTSSLVHRSPMVGTLMSGGGPAGRGRGWSWEAGMYICRSSSTVFLGGGRLEWGTGGGGSLEGPATGLRGGSLGLGVFVLPAEEAW